MLNSKFQKEKKDDKNKKEIEKKLITVVLIFVHVRAVGPRLFQQLNRSI